MQDPTPLKQAGEDVATSNADTLLKRLYDTMTDIAAVAILGLENTVYAQKFGEKSAAVLIEAAEYLGEGDYEQIIIARAQELASEIIGDQLKG